MIKMTVRMECLQFHRHTFYNGEIVFWGIFFFFGLSVLQTWIMPDEFYGAVLYFVFCFWLCFHLFKNSSHLLKLFRKMLEHCFVVELQKCFVNMVVSTKWQNELSLLNELFVQICRWSLKTYSGKTPQRCLKTPKLRMTSPLTMLKSVNQFEKRSLKVHI